MEAPFYPARNKNSTDKTHLSIAPPVRCPAAWNKEDILRFHLPDIQKGIKESP